MERCYTTNSLLKYLYRETSLTQTLEIEHAIAHDDKTKAIFEQLKTGYRRFPKVKFRAKDGTLNSILRYSSASNVDCVAC